MSPILTVKKNNWLLTWACGLINFKIVSCDHELIGTRMKPVFMWLPIHVRLGGTLAADSAAKAAPSLAAIAVSVLFTDFQVSVNCYLKQKWQMEQDAETSNKLHAIKPVIYYCNDQPV
jgi:hypothetical protein